MRSGLRSRGRRTIRPWLAPEPMIQHRTSVVSTPPIRFQRLWTSVIFTWGLATSHQCETDNLQGMSCARGVSCHRISGVVVCCGVLGRMSWMFWMLWMLDARRRRCHVTWVVVLRPSYYCQPHLVFLAYWSDARTSNYRHVQ